MQKGCQWCGRWLQGKQWNSHSGNAALQTHLMA
jgi:hypothetical protein